MVVGNMCILSNAHNTSTHSINLQLWQCDYMAPRPIHLPIFNTLHFIVSVGGQVIPCNLTQVVYDTPGGTTFGETITTFYGFA
jgi:hypothetical protein